MSTGPMVDHGTLHWLRQGLRAAALQPQPYRPACTAGTTTPRCTAQPLCCPPLPGTPSRAPSHTRTGSGSATAWVSSGEGGAWHSLTPSCGLQSGGELDSPESGGPRRMQSESVPIRCHDGATWLSAVIRWIDPVNPKTGISLGAAQALAPVLWSWLVEH